MGNLGDKRTSKLDLPKETSAYTWSLDSADGFRSEVANELFTTANVTWEQGAIDGTVGTDYDSTSYSRTVEYIDARSICKITSTALLYMIFAYNEDHELIKHEDSVKIGERTNDYLNTFLDGVRYIRLTAISNTNTTDFVKSDIAIYKSKNKEEAVELFDELDSKYGDYVFAKLSPNWKQGWIGAGGVITDSTKGVYVEQFALSDFYEMYVGGGLYAKYAAYDIQGNFLGLSESIARNSKFTHAQVKEAFPDTDYINIMIFYGSDKETPVSDVEQYVTTYGTMDAAKRTVIIVQSFGTAEDKSMSQKAVTDELLTTANVTWEQGGIDGTNMTTETERTDLARTDFIDARSIYTISANTGVMVFYYNSIHKPLQRDIDYTKGVRTISVDEDTRYIRIVAQVNQIVTLANIRDYVTVKVDKHYKYTDTKVDTVNARIDEYIITEYPIEWKQGYIGGDGVVNRGSMIGVYAEKIEVAEFIKLSVGNNLYVKAFVYDGSGTLIGNSGQTARNSTYSKEDLIGMFPDGAEVQFMVFYSSNKETPVSDVEQHAKIYCTTMGVNRMIADSEYWWNKRQRFNDKPIMVGYSDGAGTGPSNTEMAYISAAVAGFRWLKADVQPTSDGKLIMCHDDGFTLDQDGYITTFDDSNKILIHDVDYDWCHGREYATKYHIHTDYDVDYDGDGTSNTVKVEYHPSVCDLEDFLKICKEFEVRPYIVIRDKYIDVVVPELLRLLEAYDFLDNCIVNSFTLASVQKVAEQSNHRVMISVVKSYATGKALTIAEIDNLLRVSPNCTINIYVANASDTWNNAMLAEASSEAISYAKSKGVVVGTASVKEPHPLFTRGIGLMQCDTVCIQTKVTPINLCVSLLDGVATVERSGAYSAKYTADAEVDANKIKLRNVRLLGSSRDFSDGIVPNLASVLPYTLTVTGDNVQSASLIWGCEIHITLDDAVADLDTSTKKKIFVKFAYGI